MPTAIRAADFLRTLGVQTHMAYTDNSPFGNDAWCRAALGYLNPKGVGSGLYIVRDDPSAPMDRMLAMGKDGYRFDLYCGYNSPANNGANHNLGPMQQVVNAGYAALLEGPLEVDNEGWGLAVRGCSYTALSGRTYNDWQAAVAMQMDLYSTFYGKVPVALWSLANPGDGSANSPAVQAASQLGTSVGAIADWGNVHFYPHNGNPPITELPGTIQQETGYTSGKPFAITETGFNDLNANDGTNYWGSQYSNACYTMNLYLDAFQFGSRLTVYYELFDDLVNSSAGSNFEDYWGLFLGDGSPKQSAVALRNMVSVLSDTGAAARTFRAGSLNYSIAGLPSNGRSQLFQRSDGAFIVAVWVDANIFPGGRASAAPGQNLTVNLGTSFPTVNVFDPLQNAAAIAGRGDFATSTPALRAISTVRNQSAVQITVTDHPILIEMLGSTGTVSPPKPAKASANGTSVTKPGQAIVNSAGESWSLVGSANLGNQIAVDGTVDPITSNVTELRYVDAVVWQCNTSKMWWGKKVSTDMWTPTAGTNVAPASTVIQPPPPPPGPTPQEVAATKAALANAQTALGNAQAAVSNALKALGG